MTTRLFLGLSVLTLALIALPYANAAYADNSEDQDAPREMSGQYGSFPSHGSNGWNQGNRNNCGSGNNCGRGAAEQERNMRGNQGGERGGDRGGDRGERDGGGNDD